MKKIALSDDLKSKLKTTAKVVALGAAGATLGSKIGKNLASTRIGNKIFQSRPAQGLGKVLGGGADLSKAKTAFGKMRLSNKSVSSATIGGILGAHAFGVGGDFAAIASSRNDNEKKASMTNRYLEKIAGAKLNALAANAGGTKPFGRLGSQLAGKAMGALKSPMGMGMAGGAVAGSIMAGLIKKRQPEGSVNVINNAPQQ